MTSTERANARGTTFMTMLGVAADITAIAALVFSRSLDLLVQIVAVAGIAIGIFLLLRQWGRPVGMRVVLAMVCVTVGCVAGALSLQSDVTSLQAGSTGTTTGGNTSAKPGAEVAFQFRLTPYTGIDLDAGRHNQNDVVDTDGPNGDIDLFMSQFGYVEVNGGSFYVDAEGPDSEAYSRCSKALAAQRGPRQQIQPIKGIRVCFKTSGGKVGWLLSNSASFDGQTYAVINVRIW